MKTQNFDRGAHTVGNIVALEHVNVTIPDQRLATLFYVSGLGGTRDPYLMVGDENMWINFGREQFHLPARGTQVLRGHTALVVPDLQALTARLDTVRPKLAQTRFEFTLCDDHVVATCPWGNEVRCYAPGRQFDDMRLGIPYVEFTVPRGAAPGIARFYESVFAVNVVPGPDAGVVRIPVGRSQAVVFRETDAPLPSYDGHHIAIYVADFGGIHERLGEQNLVTEESDAYQYRFKDIIDPADGAHLYEIEHEVRSLTHPLYARPLVNRNPAQTNRNYQRGCDAFYG